MSLRLISTPATPDQLLRLRADPPSFATVLDPAVDPDRQALRHGPVVHLRTSWHVLHFLLTRGGAPELGFLLVGGAPVGERARALSSAEVRALGGALDQVRPEDLSPRFDRGEMRSNGIWFYHLDDVRPEVGLPVALERLREVQALVRAAVAGGAGVLVVRHRRKSEVTVDLHLAGDRAIERYVADPALLEAHLDPAPHLPAAAVAVRGWFALSVGLTELGDSPAHRFLEDGGQLVDETLQLRVFEPSEVAALHQVLQGIDPGVLGAALSPAVLDRDGLDPDEREGLLADYPALRQQVAGCARAGEGLVTWLG